MIGSGTAEFSDPTDPGPYFILVNGEPKPATSEKNWHEWMGERTRRGTAIRERIIRRNRLRWSKPGKTVLISTIFTGIDMSTFQDGPSLFRTCVFTPGRTYEKRTHTREEAEIEHLKFTLMVRAWVTSG